GDVLHVLVDVALDEATPAQDAQLRAFLRHILPLRVGILDPDHRPDCCSCRHASRGLQESTAFEFTHQLLLENCARSVPARLAVDCCGDDSKSSAFCDEPHTALRIE